MAELARWYVQTTMGKTLEELPEVAPSDDHDHVHMRAIPKSQARATVGFFQIGGGIAGDFPICVVPMLQQDLQLQDTPRWGYFCQISDSTTSYGSYSGAVPNEKITWGKLSASTPKYIIESDATIVAPLIFAHVLGQ
jgi:deoxyhypusine synthase